MQLYQSSPAFSSDESACPPLVAMVTPALGSEISATAAPFVSLKQRRHRWIVPRILFTIEATWSLRAASS
jgi:hypothetical protein